MGHTSVRKGEDPENSISNTQIHMGEVGEGKAEQFCLECMCGGDPHTPPARLQPLRLILEVEILTKFYLTIQRQQKEQQVKASSQVIINLTLALFPLITRGFSATGYCSGKSQYCQ